MTRIIFWSSGPDLFYFLPMFFEKTLDFKLYCIFDIPDKPKNFFETQSFVKFEKVWFYHDHIQKKKFNDLEYLQSFEEKYGIELWKLAINERLFYRFNEFYKFSSEEIISILSQECKLFETILDEAKPEFLIMGDPALHHSRIFYEMCKKKNIKIMILQSSRIGKKCLILDDPQEIPKIKYDENYDENYDEDLTFENIRQIFNSNSYKKIQKIFYKKVMSASILILIKTLLQYLGSNSTVTDTHYTYYGRKKSKVIYNKLKIELKQIFRKKYIDNNLSQDISSKKFVYFPLHIEMEQYPLIAAPFFTNHIEVIRHIAKSLPVGYELYVKEHPAQVLRGWRQISDYKEILKIPNVTLFHPEASSDNLIKNSSLVVTIAGTTGFEAAFYGKPSIVFSNTFYDKLKSVYRVRDLQELPRIIKNVINEQYDPHDLYVFLKQLDEISFDFNYSDFYKDLNRDFYLHGNLTDVEITMEQVEKFKKDHKFELEKLAEQYIMRIK